MEIHSPILGNPPIPGEESCTYSVSFDLHNREIPLKEGLNFMATQAEQSEANAAFWDEQGRDYAAKENDGEAIAAFDKAIALNPTYAEAWNHKGSVLANSKRYAEALAMFDKAVALQPQYHQAWFNRGLLLTEMGAYGTAVESYDRAIASSSGAVTHQESALEPDQVYLHAREDIFLKKRLIAFG
jgi:tetratricopeptide (TPR) repeat protein